MYTQPCLVIIFMLYFLTILIYCNSYEYICVAGQILSDSLTNPTFIKLNELARSHLDKTIVST